MEVSNLRITKNRKKWWKSSAYQGWKYQEPSRMSYMTIYWIHCWNLMINKSLGCISLPTLAVESKSWICLWTFIRQCALTIRTNFRKSWIYFERHYRKSWVCFENHKFSFYHIFSISWSNYKGDLQIYLIIIFIWLLISH